MSEKSKRKQTSKNEHKKQIHIQNTLKRPQRKKKKIKKKKEGNT